MKVETVWVCLLCVCEKNKAKKKKENNNNNLNNKLKRLKTQICFVVVDNRKKIN